MRLGERDKVGVVRVAKVCGVVVFHEDTLVLEAHDGYPIPVVFC